MQYRFAVVLFWCLAVIVTSFSMIFAFLPPREVALPLGIAILLLALWRLLTIGRMKARLITLSQENASIRGALWSRLGPRYTSRLNLVVAFSQLLLAAVLIARSTVP